jgi:hypothetical protein
VEQHKQHIAGDEFRECLTIFWRNAFEPWITAERECGRGDLGLKFLCFGLRRLGEKRPGGHHDEGHKKQHMPPPEMPRFRWFTSKWWEFALGACAGDPHEPGSKCHGHIAAESHIQFLCSESRCHIL